MAVMGKKYQTDAKVSFYKLILYSTVLYLQYYYYYYYGIILYSTEVKQTVGLLFFTAAGSTEAPL